MGSGRVVAAIVRPLRRTTKTLPSSVAASSCARSARPRASRSASACETSRAAPAAKRSARAGSDAVVAMTDPSSSMIATSTTCDEISVRSARA